MSTASPSAWQRVHLDRVAPEPWRNGGGTTRELLAWPDPSDWTVRLSVAEITRDGPFSTFAGVRRWFAVLAGPGVLLHVREHVGEHVEERTGEHSHRLTPGSLPIDFDGGAAVSCALIGGATQDFNLMARGGDALLARIAHPWSKNVNAMTLIAAYAHAERATAVFDDETVDLPARTLVWRWVSVGGAVRVAGDDVLWMEFAP